MSDVEALKVILPFLGSAAPLGLFAWLVYRLVERSFKAQAKREEAFELAAEQRATSQAERDGALLRFMGMLEERTRPLAWNELTPVPQPQASAPYHIRREATVPSKPHRRRPAPDTDDEEGS